MEYIATIGLEMHCEIKSKSKVFSSAANFYNETPNSNVVALDMALPGTLPVLNKEAVRKAIMIALALNCNIPDTLIFERKNYYYPDLPKGYQITQQNYKPIGTNGKLLIEVDNQEKEILINNIHLEEDTASLDHFDNYSLIDYNRAGVPLLECVSEPCMHKASEAVAFLETMRNIYRYTDISEADTKKGQIRCDVNISLSDSDILGTKVEIKNINSFKAVKDAINYEINRQLELINSGNINLIEQETRRWDEESGTTIKMRSKEDAIDYKYFVEPNIPLIKISPSWIEEIKNKIPLLPLERKKKYLKEYNLSEYDANVIIKDKNIADYFDECLNIGIDPKTAANWLTVNILGYLNKNDLNINDLYLKPVMLKFIIDKINSNEISSKQAKEIFIKVIEEKLDPKNYITKESSQISDEEEILNIITNILDKTIEQIKEYKSGKDNLFQYFVGLVMKETKGKANPNLTKELLIKELEKY